jgi:hypothetical protein
MWPFKKKKEKQYIHDVISFSEPALTIEKKVHDWINSHQQYEPVSVAFSPSGISGILFGLIIYKYEVK